MEQVKMAIYKYILSKGGDVSHAALDEGVEEYIRFNGLDKVPYSGDRLEKYIRIYLLCFDRFDGKSLERYFRDFKATNRVREVTNGIFCAACRKLMGNTYDARRVKELFDEFCSLYAKLYRDEGNRQMLDTYMSECSLEAAYVIDGAEKYSIRMGEFAKKEMD